MITLEPELRLALWVQGWPRTKGSMKCLGARGPKKKHVIVESHVKSKPWRIRITNEIVREVKRAGLAPGWKPYAGALHVIADFRYERVGPTAQISPYPTVNGGENANGDLDKLLRNLLDSLEGSGLIKNDCTVVKIESTKQWAAADMPSGVWFDVIGLGPVPEVEAWTELDEEEGF